MAAAPQDKEDRKRRLVAQGELCRARIRLAREALSEAPELRWAAGVPESVSSLLGGKVGRSILMTVGPFLMRHVLRKPLLVTIAGMALTAIAKRLGRKQ